jgi:hypothetical protein
MTDSTAHLQDFFKNTWARVSQPEFLYAGAMAISFVAACALLSIVVYIVVRLVRANDHNKINVSALSIPTLHKGGPAQKKTSSQFTPLYPVFKNEPLKVPKPKSPEEILSEHIINMVQPNRRQPIGV